MSNKLLSNNHCRSVLLLSVIVFLGFVIFHSSLLISPGVLEYGDLRMHSNISYLGNFTDSVFNYQFGNNNYYYLSFAPVIDLLKLSFPDTHQVQIFLFFFLMLVSALGVYALMAVFWRELQLTDTFFWPGLIAGSIYTFSFYNINIQF